MLKTDCIYILCEFTFIIFYFFIYIYIYIYKCSTSTIHSRYIYILLYLHMVIVMAVVGVCWWRNFCDYIHRVSLAVNTSSCAYFSQYYLNRTQYPLPSRPWASKSATDWPWTPSRQQSFASSSFRSPCRASTISGHFKMAPGGKAGAIGMTQSAHSLRSTKISSHADIHVRHFRSNVREECPIRLLGKHTLKFRAFTTLWHTSTGAAQKSRCWRTSVVSWCTLKRKVHHWQRWIVHSRPWVATSTGPYCWIHLVLWHRPASGSIHSKTPAMYMSTQRPCICHTICAGMSHNTTS